ncbi:MAG TPA: aminopeptidase P family N-terminal domain-containing protein, partial [Magnetospirillaceae bacterium]|nr:aminopeptidase P family N-terminal domain-containing protein [Magnetospirillaceae bacterium]
MSQGIGGSDAAKELAGLKIMPHRPPPIAAVEHAARLERARSLTAALGAKALLIGAGASLRYFTGVPWAASERLVALVLPVKGRPVMICPAFEQGSLLADLRLEIDLHLWEEDQNPAALVGQALAGAGTLALDPELPVGLYHALKREAPSLALIDGAPVVQACR